MDGQMDARPRNSRHLKTYARRDREMEIEEQTIKDINSLSEQDALWYIQNLRNKPQQVTATGKNQMDVSGIISLWICSAVI